MSAFLKAAGTAAMTGLLARRVKRRAVRLMERRRKAGNVTQTRRGTADMVGISGDGRDI